MNLRSLITASAITTLLATAGRAESAATPLGPSIPLGVAPLDPALASVSRLATIASSPTTVVAVHAATGDPAQGTGNDLDIFVRRSFDGGATWTADAVLNHYATTDNSSANDLSPTLATDGEGTWLALWLGPLSASGAPVFGNDPVFSVSGDDGVTWSPTALVRPGAETSGLEFRPVAAYLGRDGEGEEEASVWGAAWTSQGSGVNVIHFVRSIDGGKSWEPPVQLSVPGGQTNDSAPAIASDGQGRVVVGWRASEASTTPGVAGLAVVVSDDFGATFSAPSLIVASNPSARVPRSISLAFDGAGGWLCTWPTFPVSAAQPSVERSIALARSDDGITWSAPEIIEAFGPGEVGVEPVVTASGQRVVLAWAASTGSDGLGADFDVVATQSDDSGMTWSLARKVNAGATGDRTDQRTPEIALTSDGFAAVWLNEPGVAGGPVWSTGLRAFGPAGACAAARGDADCDDDGADDACAIAGGWLDDCAGTGTPDGCAIVAGLVDDCDGDGVPDACAIAEGLVEDCNEDGIPDPCQLADYRSVLGTTNFVASVPGLTTTAALIEHFNLRVGVELATAVEINWGFAASYPNSATLCLWSDPDGDGVPVDAVLVASVPFVPNASLPGNRQIVPIPPVDLGVVAPNGLFVGYLISSGGTGIGAYFQGRPSSRAGTAFLGLAPAGTANPAAIGATMSLVPQSAVFGSVSNFGFRVIAASEFDPNGDGLLLGCPSDPDINGDGVVNGSDLGLLLALWGSPGPPYNADLNGDEIIDGGDLGLLLAAWGG